MCMSVSTTVLKLTEVMRHLTQLFFIVGLSQHFVREGLSGLLQTFPVSTYPLDRWPRWIEQTTRISANTTGHRQSIARLYPAR